MSLSSELQCRPEEPSDAKAEMAVGTSTPLSWASFDCAWAMDTQVRIWVFPDPISPWGSQKPIVAHECIGQMLNVLLGLFFRGAALNRMNSSASLLYEQLSYLGLLFHA